MELVLIKAHDNGDLTQLDNPISTGKTCTTIFTEYKRVKNILSLQLLLFINV